MSVTDRNVLNEVQYHLIETPNSGASLSSDLWTIDELIGALNDAQRTFLKDTAAIFTRATLATIPNTTRHTLPVDWILTQRVAWHSADGSIKELPRADGWEADNAQHDWPYDTKAKPDVYMDAEVPTREIQVAPAAYDDGVIEVLYVALGAVLSNTGIALVVPDECTPAVKYKAMHALLSKDGRAQDPARAGYCLTRYQEGVEAVRVMLAGWA